MEYPMNPVRLRIAFIALLMWFPGQTWPMKAFASHIWKSLRSDSKAAKEEPFEWPDEIGNAALIGSSIADTLKKRPYTEPFLFGASTSEHQCSKQCTPRICSWERFAIEKKLSRPYDAKYPIDFWNNYRSYINYAKDVLGLNTLRFSVEWAVIQPEGPDSFNAQALAHYQELFIYCLQKGITPIICFHHYTDPCWFIDAGGFEDEKNISYFVTFCTTVYRSLMEAVRCDTRARLHLSSMTQPLFATFNSPEGYAFKAYLQMKAPPAREDKKGLKFVAECLKNMMEAHVQVYYALKDAYETYDLIFKQTVKAPHVGFLKNIIQLDPAQKTRKQRLFSGFTRIVCAIGNLLQNECIFKFFTTGKFRIYIPTKVSVKHINNAAVGALDFIGINYYSNRYLYLGSGIEETDNSYKTDNNNYRIHPQGLYRAIVEVTEKLAGPLAIPIYVTENGIATRDDTKRAGFYRGYLYALARALQDGYDVRGYLTWTLADNYEWPNLEDETPRVYGLCSVNPLRPSELQLKDGAREYIEIVKHALH